MNFEVRIFIDIQIKNKKVEVDERDCDHHGMPCYFTGVYEKWNFKKDKLWDAGIK
jgi:hypothetical protein